MKEARIVWPQWEDHSQANLRGEKQYPGLAGSPKSEEGEGTCRVCEELFKLLQARAKMEMACGPLFSMELA